MFKLIKELELIHESGVSADINAFFRDERNVSSMDINFDDDRYIVDVVLTQCTHMEMSDMFHSFVKFMEYSCFSFYQKTILDDGVKYNFVTSGAGNKGFYCIISFRERP
jgi:hypothetical protein